MGGSGKLCPITSCVLWNPSMDVNQKRESMVNMQTSYNSKCTNLSFHMSPSSNHVHSPFVLKKDILVPWGMTILMSRDELLIEWRGQVRQFTCSVPYQAVSAVIHVFDIYRRKILLACLNSSVKVFFNVSSQPARGKRRMGDRRLCRPLELCCSLQICTWREIDATLLCCTALRYICSDNEIEFHPDWTGWWHQYEIALVFLWLLPAFNKDSLSCPVGHLTCIFYFFGCDWIIEGYDSIHSEPTAVQPTTCLLFCL